MAQVVAHDGTRLLILTRTAQPQPGMPLVNYGRILDLSRMVMWPEMYLESILAHTGPYWEPLEGPVPADRLLAMAKAEPLA
jgi:hypothetical protein